MTIKIETVIPEVIKDMIHNMNRKSDPVHIRENFRNRLEDIAHYINMSVNDFNTEISTGFNQRSAFKSDRTKNRNNH